MVFLGFHIGQLKDGNLMLNISYRFNYYTFVIVFLPFLSFLNGNIEDLNTYQFAAPLLVGIVISFFILLLSVSIAYMFNVKYTNSVGVFLSICIYILFSFKYWDINKYLYLFIFSTAPITLSFFLSRSENFRSIFSMSVYAMFLVSIVQVANNYINANSDSISQSEFQPISSKVAFKAPNVYFFMLDAYSRSDELAKLDINNDYFIEQLIDNDFYVAKQSTSNFMSTPYSLQALYSMEYPDLFINDVNLRNEIILGNNSVVNNFKLLGYQHIRMGPNQATITDCSGKEDHCLFRLNELDGNAAGAGSIYTEILKMSPLYSIPTRLFPELFYRNVYNKSTIGDAQLAWKKIQREIAAPFFLEMNVWQPHAPYLLNKECDPIINILEYNVENLKKENANFGTAIRHYEGEIHCVNKQIISFINFINESDPDAIVIILSDHGHQFSTDLSLNAESWSDESAKARSSNLWAAKLPEYCRNLMYSDISPVNTFRIVFSCIYNQKIGLLPDKVFIHSSEVYKFHLFSEP